MASPELEMVVAMLRARPQRLDVDWTTARAELEALCEQAILPDGTHVERVRAGGVPAEWVRAPHAGRGVVLYLHGGGYCVGSLNTHRPLVARISAATGLRGLALDYRLGPEHRFPAAVDDAVAAYRWLLAQDVPPGEIVVAGDSAGGGLTVATLVALRDAQLPRPAGGACISPWVDLEGAGDSMTTCAALDPMVQRDGLLLMAAAYLGAADPRHPLASPLHADLHGLPPLLIHVGTAETLLDDSVRLAARAKAAGVDVELDVWDEMIHVWHAFAPLLPEAEQAIAKLGAWMRARVPHRG
jgi:monoterpene epsilon-lactone hydrolase